MTIERLDVTDDEEEVFLFNNLDEAVSHPRDFQVFRDALDRLGIYMPPEMLSEVEQDGITNMGNKLVEHSTRSGVYQRRVLA